MLIAPALLALFVLSCSGDGGGAEADGDTDSENTDNAGDEDSEIPPEDGDEDFDSFERPEVEQFVWEDDTYDQWQAVPFCLKGIVHFKEDFEAETLASYWNIDDKVPEIENGTALDTQDPVLVSENGNRFLSGRPQDLANSQPVSRLWMEIPQFEDATKHIDSYHIRFRLPDASGENLLWFHDDGDPTGVWQPEYKIMHNAEIPEWLSGVEESLEPQVMSAVNYNNIAWGHIDGLDSNWHSVEIYDKGGGYWRVDIDRVTIAEFEYHFSEDHPLKTLFIGRNGNIDDLLMGDCPVPEKGVACKTSDDCTIGMVCGRDGVCYYARSVTCKSGYQCSDESECIGISYGNDILGDGTCTVRCTQHADCRPYEVCLPYSETEGFCRSLCEGDSSLCPTGQYCESIGGVSGCLPETCRTNAEWVKRNNGLIECVCKSGYIEDPFTGECKAEKKCGSQYDCSGNERCLDGLCYRIRDISCYEGSNNCPYGTSCYGVIIDGAVSGTGQCSVDCYYNADCLPYELCMWLQVDEPHCVGACNDSEDCGQNLKCINTPAGGACMPERCKPNAAWVWNDSTQSINCECIDGYFEDTVSGSCRTL